MPTALERFVRQEGRCELVDQVGRQIADSSITYIYFQFVSVTGRIMGKGIPAARCWIALEDNTAASGTVECVRGSH